MKAYDKIVPDTSVIIEGVFSARIENKELVVKKIIIHEAVLAELEHQANEGKSIGLIGLEEIKKIKALCAIHGIELGFAGQRPKMSDIKFAGYGEIDAMIRQLAYDEGAVLMTADKVQAKVADAKGIECVFVPKEKKHKRLILEDFFDETTMSVHLKENTKPIAKKGLPGNWSFVVVDENRSSQDLIKEISRQIIEESGSRDDGFIEIERIGSTIIQLGNFRIVITRPPFSDGWEITAVRPVKQTVLADYNLSDKLLKRLSEQAEGILISGPPGMGKSTFGAALFRYYLEKKKIVKTVEAPRDLVLPDEITQYAISHGSSAEVHDILLLSRPDYTLFDEMRNREDFELFADLRLSGIGLAGVIHATKAIDSIQRFVGKIELGVIPHVIDTVIFIKNGKVEKVLSLQMTVKVPAGMTEADLARPIVTVDNFETGKPEFELYSYGEETVVVPVDSEAKEAKSGLFKLAEEQIREYFLHITTDADVEMLSDGKAVVRVPAHAIAGIIGKQGSHITQIEADLGIKLDIEELGEDYGDDEPKKKKHKKNRR